MPFDDLKKKLIEDKQQDIENLGQSFQQTPEEAQKSQDDREASLYDPNFIPGSNTVDTGRLVKIANAADKVTSIPLNPYNPEGVRVGPLDLIGAGEAAKGIKGAMEGSRLGINAVREAAPNLLRQTTPAAEEATVGTLKGVVKTMSPELQTARQGTVNRLSAADQAVRDIANSPSARRGAQELTEDEAKQFARTTNPEGEPGWLQELREKARPAQEGSQTPEAIKNFKKLQTALDTINRRKGNG